MLAQLLKKGGWKRQKYAAIKSWATNTTLWDEWEKIYTNLENENSLEDAEAFYKANEEAMLEGVDVLWPEGEPYYRLMEFKLNFGLAALYSEKQNEPFDPDRQILNPDLCETFTVLWPGDVSWPVSLKGEGKIDGFVIWRGEKGFIHSSDLKIIAFHDPAMGEDPKKGKTGASDYAAIVVCGQDHSSNVYVLDVYLKRDKPSQQIANAFSLYSKWGVEAMYLETVGFQGLLKRHYQEAQEEYGSQIRVIGVNQHKNKLQRIAAMEPYFSNGWIRLNSSLNRTFIDQIRLFPTVNDDGPDALEGCINRLRKPGGHITQARFGEVPY